MLIESLVLGLLVLMFRQKLVLYIKTIEYRGLGLPIAAFGLESLAAFALTRGLLPQAWVFGLSLSLEAVLYGLLLGFAGLNHRLKGFGWMGLGLLLNALVILANGGQMPVDGSALLGMGFQETYNSLADGQIFAHELINSGTRLSILADVIHLPPPYPFPKSVSLGDLLLGLGVLYHLAGFSAVRPTIEQPAKEVS